MLAEGAAGHDLRDSLGAEEAVIVMVNGRLKGLVSGDLSLTLQEALKREITIAQPNEEELQDVITVTFSPRQKPSGVRNAEITRNYTPGKEQ